MSFEVSGVSKTSNVANVKETKNAKSAQNDNKNLETTDENELMTLDEMVDEGLLKPEKCFFGLFKTGNYVLTADGKKTFGQIKEELGLEDGALRNSNYKLFQNIDKNADDVVPEKDTKIVIKANDLKPQEMNLLDDEGKPLDGFYKSQDGSTFYEVQYGDTKDSIYEKFANKALKDYNVSDVLKGYPEYNLQVGTKVTLPEKGFFAKLFS